MKKFTFLFALSAFVIKAQNPLYIPDTLSGTTINLALKQGTVAFYNPQVTNTYGANGNILGPTLLLNKNYSVTINVNNQLPDTTTIHWHGLHVSPLNDGGPHITIPPTTTWSPSFTVKDWAATYWYHPHLHMRTNEHVQKGIAGFIIVRDSVERLINLPRTYGIDDFPLALQTKAFDANKQIVVMSALDTAVMVNATLKPFLNAPAQVIRFRVLNGSSERAYNIGFTGNKTFFQIASDGGLLTAPISMTRLRLLPGERAEILIDLAPYNGQSFDMISFGAELPNAIYGATQPGMGPGQVIPSYSLNPLNGNNFTLLKLNVVPATANPVTTIPTTLVAHNIWPQATAAITRTITFMPANMGPTAIQGPFMFNNQMFDMNVINYQIPFNNVEIWQLQNQTPIAHPFHIHDVHFYVLDINGNPPPLNEQGRKDVIMVPAGNSIVRFITKFETFYNDTAPYMYHCHMLTHEDGGMMGQFVVNSPVGIGVKENKLENRNLVLYPNPGTDKVYVKLEKKISTYYVTDVMGKIVLNGNINTTKNFIDIGELKNGVYFVKFEGSITHKLIKE